VLLQFKAILEVKCEIQSYWYDMAMTNDKFKDFLDVNIAK